VNFFTGNDLSYKLAKLWHFVANLPVRYRVYKDTTYKLRESLWFSSEGSVIEHSHWVQYSHETKSVVPELKGSSPHSQQPATGPSPEPIESTPPANLPKIHSDPILILMKLFRLIKICLDETYSNVHIGKHMSDTKWFERRWCFMTIDFWLCFNIRY
jgi:hypothetical protein